MNKSDRSITRNFIEILIVLFGFSRIVLFLALIPNNFYGPGDFRVYFQWASIPGWPFFDYWIEYPPAIALFVKFIYLISGGSQFIFDFMLVLCVTAAGMASIWLVKQIAGLIYSSETANVISLVYFGLIAAHPYTWWYLELIPVALMLAGAWAVLKEKDIPAGIWIGLGILTKWFSIFLLPALWRLRKPARAARITAVAVTLVVLVWGALFIASPTMTKASLISQPSRSSWQTIWALIDGNMTTGFFLKGPERFDPRAAEIQSGNPPVVPPWLTLAVFAGLGLFLLLRTRRLDERGYLSFVGVTWGLFLLWSSGWSPQWILYLIPLILLTHPLEKGLIVNLLLVFLTIIEWPTMLKRNLFESLWIIAPMRMAILGVMILLWIQLGASRCARKQITVYD